MSRIGKKPIPIPKGVTVNVAADAVEIQGPKGKLRQPFPPGIAFEVKDGQMLATTIREDKALGKFHGLGRSLVANAVTGVTEGFKRELDIVGIGYRAELKGRQVVFALGYSHPIVFDIPQGIDIAIEKQTHVTVTRHRPAAGRPGRRRHPPDAEAGPLQAEGRPLHRRGAEEEGRARRARSRAGQWQLGSGQSITRDTLATSHWQLTTGAIRAVRTMGCKRPVKTPMKIKTKEDRRDRIKLRLRKRIVGSAERPRLTVFRSVAHMYVQAVDDADRARRWPRPRRSSRPSRRRRPGRCAAATSPAPNWSARPSPSG